MLWQVQVLSQVLNTLLGQSVVVVLPGELSLDVTLGGQRLQSLDDVQVLGVNLLMLLLVEVLLGDDNTLYLNKTAKKITRKEREHSSSNHLQKNWG